MTPSEAGQLGYAKVRHILLTRLAKVKVAARARYKALRRTCPNCGKDIPYVKRQNVHCSHRCAVLAKPREPKEQRCRKHPCADCGVPAYGKRCQACKVNASLPKTSEAAHDPRRLRSYLIRTRGRQCAVCKATTWLGQPVPIETDHIDGDYRNNSEVNVRLICPNCHALTPTYKGRNKGRGRAVRRRIYAKETLLYRASSRN